MRHDPELCPVCNAIRNNPNLSNVKLARLAETSERSIRRHKAPMEDLLVAKDPFFTDIPEAIITSRGQSIRTDDGSWHKIMYRPQDLAKIEAQQTLFSDCLRAIEGFTAPIPLRPWEFNDHAEIFGNGDDQVGKAHETGGGSKETVERVLASAHRFAERVKRTKPSVIIITDGGDILEGMMNVPHHQLTTNDLDLTEQIRVARRLVLDVFKILAPLAPTCIYVSVPSNHGQVRISPGASVGDVDNDFGIEISYQLEDICKEAESEALKNIQFIRPEKYQETAVLEVCGTKLAFNHGHRTQGGQNGHDKWWAMQDHGRMPGWDADILVVFHYHNMKVEQSGDGRWIICGSASEPSSDYFALSSGKRSKRGVTCFSVSNKVWSDLEIL